MGVFSFLFQAASVFAAGPILSKLIAGEPIKVYVKDVLVENPSFWLKLATALLTLPFILIGAFCMVYTVRARIEIRGDGIIAYGVRGKPTFDAAWRDIIRYREETVDDSKQLVVESRTETLKIHSTTQRWDELKAELESHARRS